MPILLIDDDAELCSLLGEFLKREGFTVECAHEGHLGLEKAGQPGVDLVVLDVMLPGIDGFEILRRLRAHSKVPVIMLTARGEDVDRIVGLELGADDYLQKPFNPRELAARIRAVLRRYEPQPTVAAAGRVEINGVALDPANGNPLWHANLGSTVTNGPITYELDGTQYLVVGAGDTLYGLAMLK